LLELELARLHPLLNPLVAGVKAAGVPAHGHQSTGFLQGHHGQRILEPVGQRNFDLHMLAGQQTLAGLSGVHLRWRAQNDRIHLRSRQAVLQIGGHMPNPILLGQLARLGQIRVDEGDDFRPGDLADALKVFEAEGARSCERHFELAKCHDILQEVGVPQRAPGRYIPKISGISVFQPFSKIR